MEYFYLFNSDKIEWSAQWTNGIISPFSDYLNLTEFTAKMVLDSQIGTFVNESTFNQVRNGEKTILLRGQRRIIYWLFDTERDILLVVLLFALSF
jgi:hypothetical protein